MVELKNFLGEHVLTGCDFNRVWCECNSCKNYRGEYDEKVNTIDFIINGIEYRCVEDCNDGYRSSMREIQILEPGSIKNTFPECVIIGAKKSDDDEWTKNDTIIMIDSNTKEVVLEFGTDNYEDYYPTFIAYFNPANMTINSMQK